MHMLTIYLDVVDVYKLFEYLKENEWYNVEFKVDIKQSPKSTLTFTDIDSYDVVLEWCDDYIFYNFEGPN